MTGQGEGEDVPRAEAGDGTSAVPDLTPRGAAAPPPPCQGCDLASVIERREREARGVAWAGVLAVIVCTLSWSTAGFVLGMALGAAFGLYARRFAPLEALGSLVAAALVAGVLALRLFGWL